MIEKILDKYYMKKLKLLIKQFMLNYLLDYRFVNKENSVDLEIKKVKYNNQMYRNVFSFLKSKTIFYIANYIKTQESLMEVIDSYLRSETND